MSSIVRSDKNMIDCEEPHPRGTCTARGGHKLGRGDAKPSKNTYYITCVVQ